MQQMLQEIAAAGGEVEVIESRYQPFDEEAAKLGLIRIDEIGPGWGTMRKLTLTDGGRQHLSLPALIPTIKSSWRTKIAALLGVFLGQSRI